MTFSENLTEFVGKSVIDWSLGVGISDPTGTAYRIGVTWEDEEEGLTWTDRFAAFLDTPGSERVSSLIVGAWDGMTGQTGTTAPVVEALVAAHDRLTQLTALFLGDVTYEECEVSWLQQSDVSPLFSAFPNLEHFAVRGGNGLSLGQIKHDQLKSLIVQSGGLPVGVVREVGAADLPALEHLELWLGDDGYGGDSTVNDLDPILSGDRFPRLHSSGPAGQPHRRSGRRRHRKLSPAPAGQGPGPLDGHPGRRGGGSFAGQPGRRAAPEAGHSPPLLFAGDGGTPGSRWASPWTPASARRRT